MLTRAARQNLGGFPTISPVPLPVAQPEPTPTMERNKILQVLGPAVAVGAVLVLLGVLIALNNTPPAAANNPAGESAPADSAAVAASQADLNPEEGMSKELPPLDSPEWKDGPEGLKVWDSAAGSGDEVRPNQTVTVHYTGWLKNGTVFDSSLKRGQPATFGLNGVIRGWTVGIPGMKPGGVRRLLIPSDKAYGAGGTGGIPPNSDLVFEVKLISAK